MTNTVLARKFATVGLPLLCALIVIVYRPGLTGGYIFDDYPNIVDNIALHLGLDASGQQWISAALSSPSEELKRPLAMISFAVNFALTGIDPYWMKVTNLLIHIFNTCIVFFLTRAVLNLPVYGENYAAPFMKAALPLWVAAVWALQPINLTPVLLIVQRMELLSHTFVISGLWMYVVGRFRTLRSGRGWMQAGSGILFGTGLGLLSKESAILLPVYAFALEFCVLHFSTQRGRLDRRLIWAYVIALGLPLAAGLAWLLPAMSRPEAFSHRKFDLIERLLTQTRVVLDYMQWTLLPRLNELALFHDDYVISRGWLSPPSTLLAACTLIALILTAIALRRHRPIMALGLCWFMGGHLLTATILPLELVFEHRNYFASLGLMLVISDALGLLSYQRGGRLWFATILSLLLVALYGGTTALRATEWSEPARFSLSEALRRPNSPRASYEVARNLIIASNFDENSALIDEAFLRITQAIEVPGSSAVSESAGIILAARTGRPIPTEWWQQMRNKLSAHTPSPQDVSAIEALVRCQKRSLCQLPRQEMIDTMLSAMANEPTPQLLHVYGDYAINVLHEPMLARELFEAAVELAPRQAQYRASLVNLLLATGNYKEARLQIQLVRSSGQWQKNDALADYLLHKLDCEMARQNDVSQ